MRLQRQRPEPLLKRNLPIMQCRQQETHQNRSAHPAKGDVTGQVWRSLRLNQLPSSAELCDVWLVAAVTLRPCVTRVAGVSGFCLCYRKLRLSWRCWRAGSGSLSVFCVWRTGSPGRPSSIPEGPMAPWHSSAHELKSVTDALPSLQ